MIPTLYEPFRHWSEGGSVFILSDLHFDDEDNIIRIYLTRFIRDHYLLQIRYCYRMSLYMGLAGALIYMGMIITIWSLIEKIASILIWQPTFVNIHRLTLGN